MARRNSICNRRDTTDAQTYLHLAQNFLPESGIQEETHLVERSTKCVSHNEQLTFQFCIACLAQRPTGMEKKGVCHSGTVT